jgi:hypothetical protein
MRHARLFRRLPVLLAVAVATAASATAVGVASATTTNDQSNTTTIARPAADNPRLRGATAPVNGVVAGLTGAAAQQAAGAAADNFRQHAEERIARSSQSAGAANTATTAKPAAVAAAATLHEAWGIFFNNNAAQGLQATHSVLGVTTTGGDYLYAPTALPPGNACIELTTAYTPDGPMLWGWDWCGGRDTIGKVVPMDATFLATYTTMVNGRPAYSMDEHKTSTTANTWTVYLYNYKTHAYDTFMTSTGNMDIPGSTWDFFEMYTTVNGSTGAGYYCQNFNGMSIEASGVKVSQNGAWTPANASNSSMSRATPGSAYDCPSLTLTVGHANDNWIAQFGSGGGGGQPPSSTSFEAEASGNTLAGQAAARSSAGASGGALVGYVGNGAANYLQLNNVTSATAGSHKLTIYYAAGESRSATVSVNGGAATSVNTPSTGGWDTIGSVTVTVNLNAGANTIRLANPSGWAPDFDRIVVS